MSALATKSSDLSAAVQRIQASSGSFDGKVTLANSFEEVAAQAKERSETVSTTKSTANLTILAHAVDLNALAVEELIWWCDKQIAENEKPEFWLIELSTNRKHPIDIVNQLKMAGALTEIEDSVYLTLVAGAYFRERIDYNRATQLLLERFCWVEWEVMTDLRQEIYVIDDDLEWNVTKGVKRLKSLLKNYNQKFETILIEIGVKT